MPAFYAQQVLDNAFYCVSPEFDPMLLPFFEMLGLCKTMDSYGYRKDENGLPLLEDCQKAMFAEYQMTKDAVALYHALYYNEYGLRDRFIDYWQVLAERFHENEYVIGFDPINEPFPGWDGPVSFLAAFLIGGTAVGTFDHMLLSPLYADIYAKMQESHIELPMFFEPTQIGDFLPLRLAGH